MVITAVWLRSVCWSTRKNRPRWASASTTSIALRRRRGGAQRPDCGRGVGGAEDRRAGYEGRGAIVGERFRDVGLHAAVDGDVDGPGTQELFDLANLSMRARDERLAAEARVHRHHQHEIELREHVLERRGRRGRVQRDTRARAELADLGERALEMRAG